MFGDKWNEAPRQNYRGVIKDGAERCPAGIFFDNFSPEQVVDMKSGEPVLLADDEPKDEVRVMVRAMSGSGKSVLMQLIQEGVHT